MRWRCRYVGRLAELPGADAALSEEGIESVELARPTRFELVTPAFGGQDNSRKVVLVSLTRSSKIAGKKGLNAIFMGSSR